MKKTFFAVLVSVTAAMGIVGCGGTVSSGGGGEGGSGSGSGGGGGGGAGGTGTTTTSGTTGTTTDPTTLCQDLCSAGQAAGCFSGDPAECIQGCNGTYSQYPECTAELNAAYQCAIAGVPVSGCELETVCSDELAAVQACQGGGCGEGTCSSDGNTMCSCETTCNNVARQVDCQSSAAGIECSCYEDSVLLGTCAGADLSCNIDGDGCCVEYWTL